MTVKISIFAVAMIVTCVCADVMYQPSTLTMTMPYMPYYPMDSPIYNEYKKSIYTLNQALGNICFASQNAYDYSTLYKDQANVNLELNESKNRFERALRHFDEKMNEYRQALMNYKMLLGYKNPVPITMPTPMPTPITLDDNITIDPAVM
ncbi:uncharacterized protein LOC112601150 [Melanaphis sacchari]|uniref:uncharacterized protein LOC112601150 n=1 Tax=Melanaphis sacchari TaxID=742174 RepID=UPI000DC14C6E|nr:uncharacterized protein LOC112601150 [Melanaphis sacchari]